MTRAVDCRVTVLTVNECVPRRSRYQVPPMAPTGVVCIALRLRVDGVLTTQ